MQFSISEGILTSRVFTVLRSRCGMALLPLDQVERALKGSLFTLTAMSDGEPVGMVRMVGDGAFVFLIYDLLVIPEARGRGIGRLLVSAALSRAACCVKKGDWITVGLFSAEGREGFYERMGFSRLPSPRFGAGMQKIFKSGEPPMG